MDGNSELCSDFWLRRKHEADDSTFIHNFFVDVFTRRNSFAYICRTRSATSYPEITISSNYFPLNLEDVSQSSSDESFNSPCETAGLEQLRVRGILEPPGVSDESSQCLLFILLADVVVLLPQFEVDDALLLSATKTNEKCKFNNKSLMKVQQLNSLMSLIVHSIEFSDRKNDCFATLDMFSKQSSTNGDG